MVSTVERDETLRVLGRREDRRGMLDADGLISRRVHDQQRLTQIGDVVLDRLAPGILDQRPTDREGATSKRDVCDAVTLDIIEMSLEVVQDVGDIGGRSDGDNSLCLRNAMRRGQHGGTTKGVANQNGGGPIVRAQMIGGKNQVLDVRGEIGVLELPSEEPSPVKSNLKTAIPRDASLAAM